MLWQNGHHSDLRGIRCLLHIDLNWTAGEGRGVTRNHPGRQSPGSAPLTPEKELPCFLHHSSSIWRAKFVKISGGTQAIPNSKHI